jgi:hypothetical protein
MSHSKTDIFERLNSHKKRIERSCKFYRPVAKKQKVEVLDAATRYLASEISREEFARTISDNRFYKNSFVFFPSQTDRLIKSALMETPTKHRTREGYIKIRRS